MDKRLMTLSKFKTRLAASPLNAGPGGGGKSAGELLREILQFGSVRAATHAFDLFDGKLYEIFGLDVDPFSVAEKNGWVYYGFLENKMDKILEFSFSLNAHSIYYETVILPNPSDRRLVSADTLSFSDIFKGNFDAKAAEKLFSTQVGKLIRKVWL